VKSLRLQDKNYHILVFSLRKIVRVTLEALLWMISSFLANFLNASENFDTDNLRVSLTLGFLGAILFFVTNVFFAVYKTQLLKASFDEILRIVFSVSVTTSFLLFFILFFDFIDATMDKVIFTSLISLFLQIAVRVILSGRLKLHLFKKNTGIKTLVYGSGITGQQIVDQMLFRSNLYDPLGFLDDNLSKSNFMFKGRRILGTIEDLENIVRVYKPEVLVVAITSISSAKLMRLEKQCQELKLSLRIIPNAVQILEESLKLADISNLSIEDILGRQQIEYDTRDLANFFSNKRILITGAGGSIGSELARQISKINISELFLLDRNENALLELSLIINKDGLFENKNIILCDIRDTETMAKLIQNLKPDVVFHAAALKHLVLLENFPEEAHKTNVLATKNLIDNCLLNGVQYFINISTDKAADPVSQLGLSKYLCERLISKITSENDKYISVRFGNVVGSNGSFLNTFKEQIKQGGPITVTHPEVSRYFMTIQEAVYLVLKSILVGKCGETLILDMGDPIKILDVAKKMIADSGKSIQISFTGLRKGEKLCEILMTQSEHCYSGENKYIWHTKVPPLPDGAI
jgi:FlaA1/EpsC-like NDP-sugar epimerase